MKTFAHFILFASNPFSFDAWCLFRSIISNISMTSRLSCQQFTATVSFCLLKQLMQHITRLWRLITCSVHNECKTSREIYYHFIMIAALCPINYQKPKYWLSNLKIKHHTLTLVRSNKVDYQSSGWFGVALSYILWFWQNIKIKIGKTHTIFSTNVATYGIYVRKPIDLGILP